MWLGMIVSLCFNTYKNKKLGIIFEAFEGASEIVTIIP